MKYYCKIILLLLVSTKLLAMEHLGDLPRLAAEKKPDKPEQGQAKVIINFPNPHYNEVGLQQRFKIKIESEQEDLRIKGITAEDRHNEKLNLCGSKKKRDHVEVLKVLNINGNKADVTFYCKGHLTTCGSKKPALVRLEITYDDKSEKIFVVKSDLFCIRGNRRKTETHTHKRYPIDLPPSNLPPSKRQKNAQDLSQRQHNTQIVFNGPVYIAPANALPNDDDVFYVSVSRKDLDRITINNNNTHPPSYNIKEKPNKMDINFVKNKANEIAIDDIID